MNSWWIEKQIAGIKKINNMQTENKNGMVTIILDDGWVQDYTLIMPFTRDLEIRCCSALITNNLNTVEYMTKAQALELQNIYNWEILAHTVSHNDLATLTTEELKHEITDCKTILQKQGFRINSIVFPYNSYNNKVLNETRKSYDCGIALTDKTGSNINQTPINQYALYRQSIYYDINYLKPIIDKAIKEGEWLIFMVHGKDFDPVKYPSTYQSNLNKTKAVIQYLHDTYFENVVTVKEGLEKKGNITTFGDRNGDYYFLSKEGGSDSSGTNKFATTLYDSNNAKVNTMPQYFKKNAITINSYMNSDIPTFPLNVGGNLLTYNFDNRAVQQEICFQEWHPYNNTTIYRRTWNPSTNLWNNFKEYPAISIRKFQVDFPIVPANNSVYIEIDCADVTTSSVISITSLYNVYNALNTLVSARCRINGKIIIAVRNFTSSDIIAQTGTWFKVIIAE